MTLKDDVLSLPKGTGRDKVVMAIAEAIVKQEIQEISEPTDFSNKVLEGILNNRHSLEELQSTQKALLKQYTPSNNLPCIKKHQNIFQKLLQAIGIIKNQTIPFSKVAFTTNDDIEIDEYESRTRLRQAENIFASLDSNNTFEDLENIFKLAMSHFDKITIPPNADVKEIILMLLCSVIIKDTPGEMGSNWSQDVYPSLYSEVFTAISKNKIQSIDTNTIYNLLNTRKTKKSIQWLWKNLQSNTSNAMSSAMLEINIIMNDKARFQGLFEFLLLHASQYFAKHPTLQYGVKSCGKNENIKIINP